MSRVEQTGASGVISHGSEIVKLEEHNESLEDQKVSETNSETLPPKIPAKVFAADKMSKLDREEGIMSTVGFRTAFATYDAKFAGQLRGLVCRCRIKVHKKKGEEPQLAAGGKRRKSLQFRMLAFFRSDSELEIMMADTSPIPQIVFGSEVTISRLKPLRSEIDGLRDSPEILKNQILSDVEKAVSYAMESPPGSDSDSLLPIPDGVSCRIYTKETKPKQPGVMALIGYPTVFGAYPKKLADVLQGMVARAHLLPSVQPTSNDGKERKTTHVLVLFRSEEELELMMADGSAPSEELSGQQVILEALRPIRREIVGLRNDPESLKRQITSDVAAAREMKNGEISKSNSTGEKGKEQQQQALNPKANVFKPRIRTLSAKASEFVPASKAHRERSYSEKSSMNSDAKPFHPSKKRSKSCKIPNPKEADSSSSVSGKSGSAGSKNLSSTNQFARSVYVSRIPEDADWMAIAAAFRPVGPTLRVFRKAGQTWAHVYFSNEESVELAIELARQRQIHIHGSVLGVRRRERPKTTERRMKKNIKTARVFFSAAAIVEGLLSHGERERRNRAVDRKLAVDNFQFSKSGLKFADSSGKFAGRAAPIPTFTFKVIAHTPTAYFTTEVAHRAGQSAKDHVDQRLWRTFNVAVKGLIKAPRLPIITSVRTALGIHSPSSTSTENLSKGDWADFEHASKMEKVIQYEHIELEPTEPLSALPEIAPSISEEIKEGRNGEAAESTTGNKKMKKNKADERGIGAQSKKAETTEVGIGKCGEKHRAQAKIENETIPENAKKMEATKTAYSEKANKESKHEVKARSKEEEDNKDETAKSIVNDDPPIVREDMRSLEIASPSTFSDSHILSPSTKGEVSSSSFSQDAKLDRNPKTKTYQVVDVPVLGVKTFSREMMLALRTNEKATDLPDLSKLFSDRSKALAQATSRLRGSSEKETGGGYFRPRLSSTKSVSFALSPTRLSRSMDVAKTSDEPGEFKALFSMPPPHPPPSYIC
mmetsp:Transcript_4567/g.6461  ORF Transcript_4567/g.6461 Transcript_4567/m.6461 type:complete len:995 (-) Transcript_4567:100-3084(-)